MLLGGHLKGHNTHHKGKQNPFYSAQNPLSDGWLRSQEQDMVTSCEKLLHTEIKQGTNENYSLIPLEQGWNTQSQGEEGFAGAWGCARVHSEALESRVR